MLTLEVYFLVAKSALVIGAVDVCVQRINGSCDAGGEWFKRWRPLLFAATIAFTVLAEGGVLLAALAHTALSNGTLSVEERGARLNELFSAATPAIISGTLTVLALAFALVDICRAPRWLYARKLQPLAQGVDPVQVYVEMYPTLVRAAFVTHTAGALAACWWFARCGVDFRGLWGFSVGDDVRSVLPSGIRTAARYAVCDFLPTLAKFAVGYDTIFFVVHRAMHRSAVLYRRYHALHHVYCSPTAFEGAFFDPIDLLIGNLFPMLLCAALATRSGATIWALAVLGGGSVACAHSGYDLRPLHDPSIHDLHVRVKRRAVRHDVRSAAPVASGFLSVSPRRG